MDNSEYLVLRTDISHIVDAELKKFIERHSDDDKFLYELRQYIDSVKASDYTWNIEKIKIVLSVLQLKNPGDIHEILSYLDQSGYGWQGDTYQFYNRCLRFDQRCRRNLLIDNDAMATAKVFSDMDDIFLHKDYGAITTYLFGYCLTALFSSLLKTQHRGIPYILQIACRRNSNTYRLVHEVVQICDVNTGLFSHCYEFHYAECDQDHETMYPKGTPENSLDSLLYYRDIPVIVDGYENEKLYIALLRETANIYNRTKRLDLKAKFKMLPIFLCPTIQSEFRNIFSLNLTELEIDDDYIGLISSCKQRLGSWAYELVREAEKYFDAGNSTAYSSLSDYRKIIESRRYGGKIPLLFDLDDSINRLRTTYGGRAGITSTDITNIGYLAYFLSHFMKVFTRSIRLSDGTKFTYRTQYGKHNPSKLVKGITDEAVDSLLKLHAAYAPTRQETIHIGIDSPDAAEEKRIKRKGTAYAKDIINYYRSYGVSISIAPEAEYKDSRYIFSVKLLPGTDRRLINRYAEDVRLILGVEVLTPVVMSNSIKLIISEQPLRENSLTKILESQDFKKSQMEIPYAVGYDMMGEMVIADIAQFPHLLVGGTTGSGKSSALFSLIMSIVYKQPFDKVKLLLFDFGASGLTVFDKVPHMLQPTVHEIERGRQCLLWLQREMEKRLTKKDSMDERAFVTEYKKWSSIVCVIDEFPAFVRQLTDGRGNKGQNTLIEDLLARARKIKIHFILAAQDTTNGGLGITTTNLAAGIAFRCTNWHTSRAIIGESYATKLFGKGSMYFRCNQYGLRKLQGSFIPTEEIIDLLDSMKMFHDGGYYDVTLQLETTQGLGNLEGSESSPPQESEENRLLLKMVEWLQDKEFISNNQLKHEFKMGYDVANRFLERLEAAGIVSALIQRSKRPRTVYPDKVKEFLEKYHHADTTTDDISDQVLTTSDKLADTEPMAEERATVPDKVVSDVADRTLGQRLPDSDKQSVQDLVKATSMRFAMKEKRLDDPKK